MKEDGYAYAAVVQKHTLDGASTITLMKDKRKHVVCAGRAQTIPAP